jgi:hypothetical protein
MIYSYAHSRFSESQMTADLDSIWKELDRCGPGEQQLISRADLLAEGCVAALPADVRARIEALLMEMP